MASSTPTSVIPATDSNHHNYKHFEATEPSSGRVAVAIAGYPYSPRAAILDIVDNSVAAGASTVIVQLPADTSGQLVIADNGTGIGPDILNEVLRAGSRVQERYAMQSLSRYGIGLKGAGFSLGDKIEVFTRSGERSVSRRAIELNVIQNADAWIQETREPEQREIEFFAKLVDGLPRDTGKKTGTVIVISELNIRSREIGRFKTDIARALGEAYAKFLTAGKRAVFLNEVPIEPIDPLHRESQETLVLFKREPLQLSNGSTVYFSAVSLPHPNQLPIEMRRRYRYTQTNQGFYLYRNGRLVRGGETLGMFSADFHFNAFRAELEYTTDADDYINVDVAKSVVTVTPEVTQKLQEMVLISRKTAETLWREKDVLTDEDVKGLFDESNKLIGSRANLLVDSIQARKKKAKVQEGQTVPAANNKTQPAAVPHPQPGPKSQQTQKLLPKPAHKDVPYLRPVESLPADVLYRPIFNPGLQSVVVEVNKQHPFYKAVFSTSSGEGRDSLPRRATTATQQLIYVLGVTEWGLATEDDQERLFEQYRRFASMNLRALLE
jgi:hypothetical protein